jgi:hypothetical protein
VPGRTRPDRYAGLQEGLEGAGPSVLRPALHRVLVGIGPNNSPMRGSRLLARGCSLAYRATVISPVSKARTRLRVVQVPLCERISSGQS